MTNKATMMDFLDVVRNTVTVKLSHGNTMRISYYQAGEGFPLFLLHGLGACSEVWLPLINTLKQRFRCYAIDFPGHGNSERPNDVTAYTNQVVKETILAFVDQVAKAERYALIGNSVGATLALMIASEMPECVAHIVAISPAGIGKEVAFRMRISTLPILGEILYSTPVLRLGFAFAKKRLDPEDFKTYVADRLFEYFMQPGTTKAMLTSLRYNATLKGVNNPLLHGGTLARVKCPVLIFWGELDPIVPVSHGYALQGVLPSSDLIVVRNAGHGAHLDSLEFVASKIDQFYAQNRHDSQPTQQVFS